MLAARLCFAWGIPDVKVFLHNTPTSVLNFWQAFDAVEPIGEQWRQTAELKAMMSQMIAMMMSYAGAKDMDIQTSEEAMPPRYVRDVTPKEVIPEQSPKEQFTAIARSLGFKDIPKPKDCL